MANTIIQIKRSVTTSVPPNGSLTIGELAYSYVSGKLFIGNVNATGVDVLSSKNLYDIASNATFSIGGDVVAPSIRLDDNGGVVALSSNLSTTGVSSGVYGGPGLVPQLTIDSKGRVTAASNVSVGSMSFFTIAGDTGNFQVANNETITIQGGDGIDTSAPSDNLVSIAVDSTVVRTTGSQTIGGDKSFTGNIVFSGTTFYANTTQLDIGDNILVLNADLPISVAPSENAGIEINRGSAHSNSSIYWDETNDYWALTSNVLSSSTQIFHDGYANATSLSTGTVPSGRLSGNYSGITGLGTIVSGIWNGSTINVAYGGTGVISFTTNGIPYGNGSGALRVTSAPTEGQLLMGDVNGTPTFQNLVGGTF